MGKKNKEKWESAWLNNRTYLMYYNRLMELAVNMFEWKNLPDTVDPRFLEMTLFSDGYAVFFEDEVMGKLALQARIGGLWDVYRNPISRTAYATNSYTKELTADDSVIIYNNYLRTNCMNEIELYARRLYELERTCDVNIKAQKTPVMITGTENQRLVLKNLFEQYEGNEPFIYGDASMDLKGVSVLKIDAPFVADRILEVKTQIWNEAMTFLGIANIGTSKKERLVTDEVARHMGSTEASKYTRLNARKDACKQINKMFNLDIDVSYREDMKVIDNFNTEDGTGSGVENG